jgi:hypothetical protein
MRFGIRLARVAILAFFILDLATQWCWANKLVGNPYAVDLLLIHETNKDFAAGEFRGTALASGGEQGVVLERQNAEAYCQTGVYSSPVIKTEFPFNELLPSWNFELPEGTGFAVEIRVGRGRNKWSEWFHLGRDGVAPPGEFAPVLSSKWGEVDVDYLLLTKACTMLQYKVSLCTQNSNVSPRMKLLAISYSNSLGDKRLWKRWQREHPLLSHVPSLPIALDVPYKAQLTVSRRLRGSICCPTSVAMVLAFYGNDLPTTDVAKLCYDADSHIFGDWPKAGQVLSQFGLKSWIQRFRTFDDVAVELAKGRPIIASTRSTPEDVRGTRYRSTAGHVIVVRGMTADGDLMVNDPANTTEAQGKTVYSREHMQRIWLDKGGVGIIATRH